MCCRALTCLENFLKKRNFTGHSPAGVLRRRQRLTHGSRSVRLRASPRTPLARPSSKTGLRAGPGDGGQGGGSPWSLPPRDRRGLAGRLVRTEPQLQECVCRYPARQNGVHAGGIRKGRGQGEGRRKVPRPGRLEGCRGELSPQTV